MDGWTKDEDGNDGTDTMERTTRTMGRTTGRPDGQRKTMAPGRTRREGRTKDDDGDGGTDTTGRTDSGRTTTTGRTTRRTDGRT